MYKVLSLVNALYKASPVKQWLNFQYTIEKNCPRKFQNNTFSVQAIVENCQLRQLGIAYIKHWHDLIIFNIINWQVW